MTGDGNRMMKKMKGRREGVDGGRSDVREIKPPQCFCNLRSGI